MWPHTGTPDPLLSELRHALVTIISQVHSPAPIDQICHQISENIFKQTTYVLPFPLRHSQTLVPAYGASAALLLVRVILPATIISTALIPKMDIAF